MKFKQVLAGLLVGTMVVTSAPVSGLGSLSALAASEEADDSYEKLTGLTGTADSQELTGEANGNGPIEKALDGDVDTYWHTNWKGQMHQKQNFQMVSLQATIHIRSHWKKLNRKCGYLHAEKCI